MLNSTLIWTLVFCTAMICFSSPALSEEAKKDEPKPPTKAETQKLIDEAGTTNPDWWDSTKLDYPKTLDLADKKKVKGWAPNVKIGAYFWGVVNPNPKKWHSGVKLRHHIVGFRKKDKRGQAQAMAELADSYYKLMRDWPRAAYWWQKAIKARAKIYPDAQINLSDCYFRMGNKAMAIAQMKKGGHDRRASMSSIKLWSEMGDITKAAKLSAALARSKPDQGFLALGNVYRLNKQFDKAETAYKKCVSVKPTKRNKRNIDRGKNNLATLQAFKGLDLTKLKDGKFQGSAKGFRGPVHVEVQIKDGKITGVNVTNHKEDVFYSSLTAVPAQIVEKQDVRGIDAVSGASVTSNAIMCASASALKKAMKK